jgi:hypothetical protein
MSRAWTPERVEKLSALWALEWSCSRIAGELNANGFASLRPLSRNGVIGKLYRMGLTLPVEEVRRRQGWKHLPPDELAAKRDKVRRMRQARTLRLKRPEPASTRCAAGCALRPRKLTPLAELEKDSCRFPYEWNAQDPAADELTYGYCGVKVAYDGCSWCARHLRLVRA